MLTLDDLPIVASVVVVNGTTVKNAEQIYVLEKNYRDSGEDVYVPATFLCEGDYCNILNVEGMTREI